MKKIILSLFIISLTISCQTKPEEISISTTEQTPETLSNHKRASSNGDVRRYYSEDIIEQLFSEALSTDENLKTLNDRIESMSDFKKKQLEDYEIYTNNNIAYWQSIEQYLMQISDSTIREELSSIFADFETAYIEQSSQLTALKEDISVNTSTLSDKVLIMKLLVTQPMMRNYQRNELPKTGPLQLVKETYDSLISDLKPQTEFLKQNL